MHGVGNRITPMVIKADLINDFLLNNTYSRYSLAEYDRHLKQKKPYKNVRL